MSAPLRQTPAPLVRDAIEADAAAIQAIYAHHVRFGSASFEEEAPDLAAIRERRAAVIARGLPFLVSEAQGRVTGYAYAGPFRTRSAYRYAVEDSVYVAPDATGRGYGRALLAQVIARCEALGCRQMVAVIGDSANRASIELHARLGFVPVGTLVGVGFKFGRWVDSVLMQRALGPGAETLPEGPGLPLPGG